MRVRRQSDADFVSILSSLRRGECSKRQEEVLRATADNRIESEGILATRLCTHTEDANVVNREELAALPGESRVFPSVDSHPALSSHLDQHTPVDAKLVLKVGAQVMLMKNLNVHRGLVNGARGRVVRFEKGGGGGVMPVVRFACGREEEMKAEKWPVRGQVRKGKDSEWWRLTLLKFLSLPGWSNPVEEATSTEAGLGLLYPQVPRHDAGLR